MATSLQQQLAAVAANRSNQLNLKAQKSAHAKSLVWDASEAVGQSFESIYETCCPAIDLLVAKDSAFLPFKDSVFSKASISQDRDQMTKAENGELDKVFEELLPRISLYLRDREGLYAIEWLIRRFSIHERNMEEFVYAFLPLHRTPGFINVLRLLPEKLPRSIQFLQPYKAASSNPPEDAILYAAANRPDTYSAFGRYLVRLGGVNASREIHPRTFWLHILCDATCSLFSHAQAGIQVLRESKLTSALLLAVPIVKDLLSVAGVPEMTTAACLIVNVIVSNGPLPETVLDGLMIATTQYISREAAWDVLICLANIVEKQEYDNIPKDAFKILLASDFLATELQALASRYEMHQFLFVLAKKSMKSFLRSGDPKSLVVLIMSLQAGDFQSETVRNILQHAFKDMERLAQADNDASEKDQLVRNGLASVLVFLRKSGKWHAVKKVASKNQLPTEILDLLAPSIEEQTVMEEFDQLVLQPLSSTTITVQVKQLDLGSLDNSVLSERASTFVQMAMSQFSHSNITDEECRNLLQHKCFRKNAVADTDSAFISFCLRLACLNDNLTIKRVALQEIQDFIENLKGAKSLLDFQMIVPYLINLLTNSSPIIRNHAMECASAIADTNNWQQNLKKSQVKVWSGNSFYAAKWGGSLDFKASELLVAEGLCGNIQAVAMDNKAIIHVLAARISQDCTLTDWNNASLPVANYLAHHAKVSGIIPVRLLLLYILHEAKRINQEKNAKQKAEGKALSISVLEVVREMMHIDKDVCKEQGFKYENVLLTLLRLGHWSKKERLRFLQSLVDDNTLADEARNIIYKHIAATWNNLHKTRFLLLPALIRSCFDGLHGLGASESELLDSNLTVFRSLELGPSDLEYILSKVPRVSTPVQEGTKSKRRRLASHDITKPHLNDEESARFLTTYTFVLEVVDSSQLRNCSPNLLMELFKVLEEIQMLGEDSETSLDYVKSLCLNSILAVLKNLSNAEDLSTNGSSIRCDLVVDALRASQTSELRNSALLVISNLARLFPAVILNSVMPIFTFMGNSILRADDDYSAYIINHTVSCVVPPLLDSLKSKKKDVISGTAGVLISFIAAYEHIPDGRRVPLFKSILAALGPEDFLFAVIILFIERHPSQTVIEDFLPELLRQYDAKVLLKTMLKCLDVFIDMPQKGRGASAALLDLHDLPVAEIQSRIPVYLDRFNRLTTRSSRHLEAELSKSLSLPGNNLEEQQKDFMGLIGRATQLQSQIPEGDATPEVLFRNIFLMLSTLELLEIGKLCLKNSKGNMQISVLSSVTRRTSNRQAKTKAEAEALVNFMETAGLVLVDAATSLKTAVFVEAINCIQSIVDRFGPIYKEKVLEAAQVISDHGFSIPSFFPLTLSTLARMYEILGEAALEQAPKVLQETFRTFADAGEDGFKNTKLYAACLNLITVVVKKMALVMSGENLKRTLRVLQLSMQKGSADKSDARRALSKAIARKVRLDDLFKTMQRDIGALAIADDLSPVVEYVHIANDCVHHHGIKSNAPSVFAFILEILKARTERAVANINEPKIKSTGVGVSIGDVEKAALELLESTIMRVNPDQFSPFFSRLVEWASTKRDEKLDVQSSITFCKVMFMLQEKLQSLFLTYWSHAIDKINALLQQNWNLADFDQTILLTTLLCLLTSSFRHDENGWWQSPSHFGGVATNIVRLMPLSAESDIQESYFFDAISALTHGASSQDNLKTINSQLLILLRQDSSSAKTVAVKCERLLTQDLGEEWLALLPEMLPVIQELLEDDSEDVVRETRRWVRAVEEASGESMESMLG